MVKYSNTNANWKKITKLIVWLEKADREVGKSNPIISNKSRDVRDLLESVSLLLDDSRLPSRISYDEFLGIARKAASAHFNYSREFGATLIEVDRLRALGRSDEAEELLSNFARACGSIIYRDLAIGQNLRKR